ncbi:MAG TPA: hypothetical protein VF017_17920 [Thermoanaerobaculia bacterium]|nr:hypothetical protein [Thermoanaerobaculia bacterium]
MSATLIVDDDLDQELRDLARRTGESYEALANAALRRGLPHAEPVSSTLPPFVVEPKACGFPPGIEAGSLNRLFDDLEVADFSLEQAQAVGRR